MSKRLRVQTDLKAYSLPFKFTHRTKTPPRKQFESSLASTSPSPTEMSACSADASRTTSTHTALPAVSSGRVDLSVDAVRVLLAANGVEGVAPVPGAELVPVEGVPGMLWLPMTNTVDVYVYVAGPPKLLATVVVASPSRVRVFNNTDDELPDVVVSGIVRLTCLSRRAVNVTCTWAKPGAYIDIVMRYVMGVQRGPGCYELHLSWATPRELRSLRAGLCETQFAVVARRLDTSDVVVLALDSPNLGDVLYLNAFYGRGRPDTTVNALLNLYIPFSSLLPKRLMLTFPAQRIASLLLVPWSASTQGFALAAYSVCKELVRTPPCLEARLAVGALYRAMFAELVTAAPTMASGRRCAVRKAVKMELYHVLGTKTLAALQREDALVLDDASKADPVVALARLALAW